MRCSIICTTHICATHKTQNWSDVRWLHAPSYWYLTLSKRGKEDNLAIHSSLFYAKLLINRDYRSDWTKVQSHRFNSLKVDEHTCHKICNILVFIKQRGNAQMKRFGKQEDHNFQTSSRYLYYIQSSIFHTTYITHPYHI